MCKSCRAVQRLSAIVPVAALLSCTAESPTISQLEIAAVSQTSARFGGWSEAVNVGSVVNSPFNDFIPELSPNGLSLYFTSDRPGGVGAFDLWVAQRTALDAPWGMPVNLGPVINSAAGESAPHLSRDGHHLYFASTRPGGIGSNDIWISWREHTHDDFAWQPPVNLGSNINSVSFDAGASQLYPEFYFTSMRESAPNLDIFMSRTQGNTFGPARKVEELSSAGNDQRPSIRFDGLEIFLSSNRSGSMGRQDIWVATRPDRAARWNSPVPLGAEINTPSFDQQPSISADGQTLFFSSNRPGGLGGVDLYTASRRIEP